MESRTQRSRPRSRTQKKSEAKDSLSEDRHSRGQGQGCSRPKPRTKDTSASPLQKKKVFTKIFQAISTKKRFLKNFSSASQNFNNSKNSAVLEREDRPIFEDLRPRGQGLDLRGQGLQNLSSSTSSRPRTSLRTPPLLCSIHCCSV